ncbi:MAG: sodium-dependent bicarbonate transport family permease [Pseudomonadota bacterium]
MEFVTEIAGTLLAQVQKPTLSFLIGGMVLAALGSKFEIPQPVYKFIVVLLLLKVGISAGISVRSANFVDLAVPAVFAALVGMVIVVLGRNSIGRWPGISKVDGYATAGLFGAVSASTLAASMAMLDAEGLYYEAFIGALYPFMDVAALVTAIVLARMSARRQEARDMATAEPQVEPASDGTAIMRTGPFGDGKWGLGLYEGKGQTAPETSIFRPILVDTLRSPAISALLLGIALGVLARPESVYESFYEPLFRGLLSILMLIMGMEAWQRIGELRKVAWAYIAYGLAAPFAHGFIGFGLGVLAHHLTGFSAGGTVLLTVMAASSSDISGPPTLRGALPEANPSAYVGASTGIGTPIAILSIPMWIGLADVVIGF